MSVVEVLTNEGTATFAIEEAGACTQNGCARGEAAGRRPEAPAANPSTVRPVR
jgi:hypothetical protein